MYFVIPKRNVYHILDDAKTGRAPSTCGAKLSRFDLISLRRGKPSHYIKKEKPAHAALCKHCQRAEERDGDPW
jgi:hypothetical protein